MANQFQAFFDGNPWWLRELEIAAVTAPRKWNTNVSIGQLLKDMFQLRKLAVFAYETMFPKVLEKYDAAYKPLRLPRTFNCRLKLFYLELRELWCRFGLEPRIWVASGTRERGSPLVEFVRSALQLVEVSKSAAAIAAALDRLDSDYQKYDGFKIYISRND